MASWTVQRADFAADFDVICSIRSAVFAREQGIPAALDLDGRDARSLHVLARCGGAPVGTGRIQPDGHIGRVAVLPPHRGKGLGAAIVRELVAIAIERKLPLASLSAQARAVGFYEKLGFVPRGDVYIEAGIEHLDMERRLAEMDD